MRQFFYSKYPLSANFFHSKYPLSAKFRPHFVPDLKSRRRPRRLHQAIRSEVEKPSFHIVDGDVAIPIIPKTFYII